MTCRILVCALAGELLDTVMEDRLPACRQTDSSVSLLVPVDNGAVPNVSSPQEQNDVSGKMASQLYLLSGAGTPPFCTEPSLPLPMPSLPPQNPPSPPSPVSVAQKKPCDLKTGKT